MTINSFCDGQKSFKPSNTISNKSAHTFAFFTSKKEIIPSRNGAG